jgi:hypothetical protein
MSCQADDRIKRLRIEADLEAQSDGMRIVGPISKKSV